MPINPEVQPSRAQRWGSRLAERWYWFSTQNNIGALLACFFGGILVGLWVA